MLFNKKRPIDETSTSPYKQEKKENES